MTNQKRQISKGTVASAEPSEREYVVWDTAIQGFGLRVRPTGAKSFIYVYRDGAGRAGKVKRVTIKADNPEVARVKAKALGVGLSRRRRPGGGQGQGEEVENDRRRDARSLPDRLCRPASLSPKTESGLSEDRRENPGSRSSGTVAVAARWRRKRCF